MIDQLQLVEARLPHQVERVEQPLEVLVRLDVADVEHEVALELVALGDAPHVVVGRLGREALVDGVVDDGDLLGRHVEELEDVALRRLRHRQDAIGAPGGRPHLRAGVRERAACWAGTAETAGGCSRGSSRPSGTAPAAAARSAARGDMWRACAAASTESRTARGSSTAARRRCRRGSSRRARQRPRGRSAADQDVLGLAVDPRELPQDVPDVGADAEVVELAGIDGDAHVTCGNDTCRSRCLQSSGISRTVRYHASRPAQRGRCLR